MSGHTHLQAGSILWTVWITYRTINDKYFKAEAQT